MVSYLVRKGMMEMMEKSRPSFFNRQVRCAKIIQCESWIKFYIIF